MLYDINIILNHIFSVKTVGFCHMHGVNGAFHNVFLKICKPLVVYRLKLQGVISLIDAMSYDKLIFRTKQG